MVSSTPKSLHSAEMKVVLPVPIGANRATTRREPKAPRNSSAALGNALMLGILISVMGSILIRQDLELSTGGVALAALLADGLEAEVAVVLLLLELYALGLLGAIELTGMYEHP